MASHERDKEYAYDDLSEENIIVSEGNIIMSPNESAFGVSSCGSSYFSSPSDFSSPFGSEIGSTETESEDDDFIAELSQLTRRMAEYTFQDDEDESQKKSFRDILLRNAEASGLSVKWPNSTSSSVYFRKEGCANTSEKANSESGLAMNLSSEICSDQVLTDEEMRNVQVYQSKGQPQPKKQGVRHGGKRVKGTEHMRKPQNMQNRGGKAWCKRMVNPPPPVSAQAGSGMRAVFLGGSNPRSGCSGTGVFLPSGTYGGAEPKRKAGCSTVLIPARVLQTLQQHFNNVGAQSQSNRVDGSTNIPWQNDVLARINGLLSQQKEHAEFQTRPALATTNQDQEEVKLPQEWTY